jgi:methionyl-tRNA synthetase
MTNGILVNKYSNLVARTLAMLEQKRDLTVPVKNIETDESKKLIKQLNELREKFETQFKEIKLTQATKTIVETLDVINGYIDITEP